MILAKKRSHTFLSHPKVFPSLTSLKMKLLCDYLVVGAGASSLAFIDTLLTENPLLSIILVDKNPIPGGHWVHAYDYVHLHQPSAIYGLASRQLEGNWLKLLMYRRMLPPSHRASKKEILEYYQSFVNDKVSSGQIKYFPNSTYNFEKGGIFTSLDGEKTHEVEIRQKLVNGILGQCIIPSQNPVKFPVDEGIPVITPNEVFYSHKNGSISRHKKYVVLGAGKTAMDTIIYLQSVMKVSIENIFWVIPNDVWMLHKGSPWSKEEGLLKFDGDEEKTMFELEKRGTFLFSTVSIVSSSFFSAKYMLNNFVRIDG